MKKSMQAADSNTSVEMGDASATVSDDGSEFDNRIRSHPRAIAFRLSSVADRLTPQSPDSGQWSGLCLSDEQPQDASESTWTTGPVFSFANKTASAEFFENVIASSASAHAFQTPVEQWRTGVTQAHLHAQSPHQVSPPEVSAFGTRATENTLQSERAYHDWLLRHSLAKTLSFLEKVFNAPDLQNPGHAVPPEVPSPRASGAASPARSSARSTPWMSSSHLPGSGSRSRSPSPGR